jgi:hypothetical protein
LTHRLALMSLGNIFPTLTPRLLAKYATHCLTDKFEKSGQVLQDIVNELGRRLDYKVINGLYAGKKNAVGNDGLWLSPGGHSIVVEVKTTDAYRIPLDVIAKYRSDLAENNAIGGASSILIVVGREDTGELEAQVRGSRHAWDIRLVSVEALAKLVLLKENSEEDATGEKIRSLLVPIEYTRVDALVDVVFATAKDVESESSLGPTQSDGELVVNNEGRVIDDVSNRRPHILVVREKIKEELERIFKSPVLQKSRAMLWTSDKKIRSACTVSKKYKGSGSNNSSASGGYWYAFHPRWEEFLKGGEEAYFTLGCEGLDRFFNIPLHDLQNMLSSLNTTTNDKGMYWHVQLEEDIEGKVSIYIPKGVPISLEKYSVSL